MFGRLGGVGGCCFEGLIGYIGVCGPAGGGERGSFINLSVLSSGQELCIS